MDEPERLAAMMWKQLLLVPPVDLTLVSNSLGIRVKYCVFPSEVSGVYMVTPGGKHVIGLNSGVGRARMRFSWAHEIGHYMFGDQRPGGILLEHASGADREFERRCDVFAANLLMPAHLVSRLVAHTHGHNVRSRIDLLKTTFGVSAWATNRRLEELDVDLNRRGDIPKSPAAGRQA